MRDASAGDITQGLVDAVVRFQNGDPRDDIAVLVAKAPVEAAEAPVIP